MVNLSSKLAAGAPALIRRLSTEARAAPPQQEDRLYRRLSALGRKNGMVARTINEYIREGKAVRKVELERCIHELRKYKRHRDALEVRSSEIVLLLMMGIGVNIDFMVMVNLGCLDYEFYRVLIEHFLEFGVICFDSMDNVSAGLEFEVQLQTSNTCWRNCWYKFIYE